MVLLVFPASFPGTLLYISYSNHTRLLQDFSINHTAFTTHLSAHPVLHRMRRNIILPFPPQPIQNVYTSLKNPIKQNFLCRGSYKPVPLNTIGCSFTTMQDFEHPLLLDFILLFHKKLYVSLQLYCDFLERKDHVLFIFGAQISHVVLGT